MAKKLVLKKLGVMSVAKISAIIYGIFGLIAGIAIAVMGSAFGAMAGFGGLGAAFGILMIIIMPIFYGIIGFVAGAIFAWLYNVIARWVGGIEMNFE